MRLGHLGVVRPDGRRDHDNIGLAKVGGGVTFVVPAVLSGFSVISGGSIGFQSGLKSEIFSLQATAAVDDLTEAGQ